MSSTTPLYQLGDFQFSLLNGAPQTLDWDASYRWEEQGRLLRDPAQQFLGPGAQDITMEGVLYPGFSGRQGTVEELRAIARAGKPLMLSDGLGRIYGKWAIKQLREGRGVFAPGGAARQITFSVQLVYYADDNPGLAASPLSVAPALGAAAGFVAQGLQLPAGALDFTGFGSSFGLVDWTQKSPFQALTQQATQAGFGLGQLASIAQTGIRLAGQISSGDYVGAALGTMGVLGINVDQNDAWAQIGINAANLAQAYATGNGPTGMAIALEAASLVGAPALQASGLAKPEDLQSVSTLLDSTATLGEILKVDPKVTDTLRPLIQLTGGG